MTAAAAIRLAGTGWSRELDEQDASLVIEKLQRSSEWTLAHRLSGRLHEGGEVTLNREEKRALHSVLESVRSVHDLSSRLALLCRDLDDDVYSYETQHESA